MDELKDVKRYGMGNWKRNRCLLSLSQSGLICVLWMKTVGVKVEWGRKGPAEGHPCGDLHYFYTE